MIANLASQFLDETHRQMRAHKRLAEGAMAQLKDHELFLTLDPESNSIAVIVKHMAGNMRSRFTDFLIADGEKSDRNRDQEFVINPSTTRADLTEWWEQGWERAFATIEALKPEDVVRVVTIRNESHTVLQALNRHIAHYSYHTGQIVFMAKHIRASKWRTLSIARGKSQDFKTSPPNPINR
jgi:hypothetical protein